MSSVRVAVLFVVCWSGCGGGGGGGGGGSGGFGCIPACTARNCGDDSCGGTCGSCQQGYVCSADGTCKPGCAPQCGGKTCGPDGCGGSCGSCDRGYKCGGAGTCEIDPAAQWILTVTNGKVSEKDPGGAAWDFPGGLPDPFVCLTINGVHKCTSTANDTLMPVWNEQFTGTAIALESGVVVEIWDEDVSTNDPICSTGTVSVAEANFASGKWGAQCTYASCAATLTVK
jgi:hypothetical protein